MKLDFKDMNKTEKQEAVFKAALLLMAFSAFLPYRVLYVLSVAVGIFSVSVKSLRRKIAANPCAVSAVVFLCYAATVAAIARNYVGLVRTAVFAAAACCILAAQSSVTRRFYESLLDSVLCGAVFSVVVAAVEMIFNRNVENYRALSCFTNPNFFGAALTFAIFICAYKAATAEARTFVYYAVALICAAGIYLCGSMSLWLVAFIGILLILIFTKSYRLLVIFSSIALAAVAVVLLVPSLITRLGELSATIDNRLAIWDFAMENVKKNPFFGHGFYSYKFLYDRLHETQVIYKASMAHSVYLDTVLCHGAVGALLVTALAVRFYSLCFKCRRDRKKRGLNSPSVGFIFAVGIALAIYGLIDTTFVWIQTGMILLIITLGLGVEVNELKLLD